MLFESYWQQLFQSRLSADELDTCALPNLELNAHLHQSAQVNSALSKWMPSPAAGVQRILLERLGGEHTQRATSLVAYAPNSQFAQHTHPLGEEFFVLTGTFSDANGDYPAGTYVRNPPGSSHAPSSKEGCLILVKLQQMPAHEAQRVVVKLPNCLPQETILYSAHEHVSLWHSDLASVRTPELQDGIEGLVLLGSISIKNQHYGVGEWFRCAPNIVTSIELKPHSQLWLKHGHLAQYAHA